MNNAVRFALNVDELLGMIRARKAKDMNAYRVDIDPANYQRVVLLIEEIKKDMPDLLIEIDGKRVNL